MTEQREGSNRCSCASAQPHWTDNPDHPLHITAMTQHCPICHAQPGKPCQSITSRPLNRRIHYARTEIR